MDLEIRSPKRVDVDCGKTFESRAFKEMTDSMNIQIYFSSPYHHNTNGIVERQFRTIRDYINSALKDKKKKDWAELLPLFFYAILDIIYELYMKL